MKQIKKIILSSLAVLMLFSGLGGTFAQAASSDVSSSKTVPINKQVPMQPVTTSPAVGTQAWVGVAKKALLTAMRYGGTALGNLIKKIPYSWAQSAGKAVSKWGNKAANALEKLDNWTKNSIELALISAGIPPADAILIAKFVMFFI